MTLKEQRPEVAQVFFNEPGLLCSISGRKPIASNMQGSWTLPSGIDRTLEFG
jgi:hypothetical protein